jgi:Uncharacterized conserved protein
MSARETILAAVRHNHPTPTPLPTVPFFDDEQPPLWPTFAASLQRMGGKLVEPPPEVDLNCLIPELFPQARVICSATPEVTGSRPIASISQPQQLDDVDVGVIRAAFGVAETGSVFLSERELVVNAIGYLSQHLVCLLDPVDVIGNLHHAYARPEFSGADYAVLMTGPSATADIEGVLIHGAQGVRSFTVIVAPRKPT